MTPLLSVVDNRTRTFALAAALVVAVLQSAPPALGQSTRSTATASLGVGMTAQQSDRARAVQTALRRHGYQLGAPGVDGRFGPITAAAVRRFQARWNLAVDGVVGPRTRRALMSSGTASPLREGVGMGQASSARVRNLQRMLERIGLDIGPTRADGRFGPRTAAAVRRLQRNHGLAPDGIVGAKTRRMIELVAARRSGGRGAAQERRRPQPATAHPGPTARPHPPRTPTGIAQGSTADASASRTTVIAALAMLISGAALATALLRRRHRDAAPVRVADRRESRRGGRPAPAPAAVSNGHRPDPVFADATGERQVDGHRVHENGRPPVASGRNGSRPVGPADPVFGYVTVAPHAPASPDAIAAIHSICGEAGWDLRSVIHDDEIADVRARPGLARALQRITAGEAHALVIGDIRRLTPALDDLGTLLEWFRDADARLVVPEVSIDTGTPEGAETAARLIRLSHWQREQEAESPATREEGPRPDGRTGAPS